MWPWTREAPKNLGFPIIISAITEARDFKFGTHLGFAKAYQKITYKIKSERGAAGARGFPSIWGSPLIFSQ